jgi:DNA repair protein RadC
MKLNGFFDELEKLSGLGTAAAITGLGATSLLLGYNALRKRQSRAFHSPLEMRRMMQMRANYKKALRNRASMLGSRSTIGMGRPQVV